MKVNRPDLLSGHLKKSKKEKHEDFVYTLLMALLVLAVYILYLL